MSPPTSGAADAPVRIGDLALLSDGVRAVLVSRRGGIEWACPARFDGPNLFARLLDPAGGHWSVAPVQPGATTRRYLPDSIVHEIVFDTVAGRLVLTDALVVEGDLHDTECRPPGQLFRHLRVESGKESERYLRWMARASCADADDERLQIVFAVDGSRCLDERELGHLAGYAGSRPVRVGNAAWGQHQHDVAGEVLRTARLLAD